jgi:uncharacterized protein
MHGEIARIEVARDDMQKLMDKRDDLVNKFQTIGFTYVTLDLTGYRSGSMDEVL